jgi:hypothetical protein
LQPGKLKPLKTISSGECQNLKYFFTDIDDTVTYQGLLPAFAYNAIWQLYENDIKVIPVTGRPAGWCDHLARMWPVEAVIGENGAFYFAYDRIKKKMERHFSLSPRDREEGRQRLQKIGTRVAREIPGAAIAADQDYRITDLAIDFCEDVKPLSKAAIKEICRIVEEEGANYKVSSIHVNCWYGQFDKLACVEQFLRHQGQSLPTLSQTALFIGDSPNDEPMFKAFPLSIGVANLQAFYAELRFFPQYITEKPAGYGFREAVMEILNKRELKKQSTNIDS